VAGGGRKSVKLMNSGSGRSGFQERRAWPGVGTGLRGKKKESADKPGSVVGNHSSGTTVTGGLKQPTRKRRGQRHRFPIWSCSGWGLPCHKVLPLVRCALTAPFHPYL